jgi:thiol-disulfide isomerase/thioredoxin
MARSARLALALLVCGLASPVLAGDRPADDIVKDIDAIKRPTTMAELQEGSAKKIELIGELAKAHPNDARLGKLLPQRWIAMAQSGKNVEAIKELDETLAKTKDQTLKFEGLFAKVLIVANTDAEHIASVLPAAEQFAVIAPPDDKRGPMLLSMVREKLKKQQAIGKPFELEFTDAIKGSTVSMKGLKGKVVVVDFWATWCGPCVQEMPTMKKLYAEYKDKGVEFIGVSLDQPKEKGGLDKLKKYVAENEIGWPQYYQGNGWQSEFSSRWGINSIPCVFIVDAEGNLYSVEANRKLDKLIPEVLSKKAKTSAGGGQ